jgi:gliding motility-associated-like protein
LKKYFILIILFLNISVASQAQKILGGEMYWRGDKNLTRDQNNQLYDTLELILYTKNVNLTSLTEKVHFYNKTNGLFNTSLELQKTSTLYELKNDNSACTAKNGIKVFKQTYKGVLQYWPGKFYDFNGIEIVFDRYSRETEIKNVKGIGDEAFSLLTSIKFFERLDNLSPSLQPKATEKFMFCQGKSFAIDASAFNEDNYKIQYSIVSPVSGFTKKGALDGIEFRFKPGTKFTSWAAGYSINNPFGKNSSLKVDVKTGIITGIGNEKGIFAFSIKMDQMDAFGNVTGFMVKDMFIMITDCPNTSTLAKPIITENGIPVKNISICPGEKRKLSTRFDPNINYQWKKDNVALALEKEENLVVFESGKYSLVISPTQDCFLPVESDSVLFKVKTIKAEINGDPNGDLLVRECNGKRITLTIKNNFENYDVEWTLVQSPRDSIIAYGKEHQTRDGGGFYKARFSNTGCGNVPYSEQVIAAAYPGKPEFPTSNWPKDTVLNICPTKINFSLPEYLNFDLPYYTLYLNDKPIKFKLGDYILAPGKYYFVYGNKGCLDTTNIFYAKYTPQCIEYRRGVLSPTIFTPNQDYIDDTFELFNLKDYPDFEILIYNRWGKLVFYNKGYTEKFDGTFEGKDLPDDIYNFKIIYNDGFLKDRMGSFELRR